MDEPSDERTTWVVLGGVGVLLSVMTVIYGFTSDEDAGIVLLALSAILAFSIAGYLWLEQRRLARPDGAPDTDDEYLPHASVWPLGIGLAAVVMANGLILGGLFLVPGALLLFVSVVGFAAQSRRRT